MVRLGQASVEVFYDTPEGFYEAIKTSGRFGYRWRTASSRDAADADLNERARYRTVVDPGNDRRHRTLARKKSCFWNIGDFTLKIRY
jgi:hypothetical protein